MVDPSSIFQALSAISASLSIYKFVSELLFKKSKLFHFVPQIGRP